jgi:hypothetical protein
MIGSIAEPPFALATTPNCADELLDVADAIVEQARLPLVSRCTNKALRETGRLARAAHRRLARPVVAKQLRRSTTPQDSAGSALTSGYAAGLGRRVRAAQTDFVRTQASPTTTLMSSR